jgi:hypothetical protein
MKPTECFAYNEDKMNPGGGHGHCLQVTKATKEGFEAELCSWVLERGICPRKHKSPYLGPKEAS